MEEAREEDTENSRRRTRDKEEGNEEDLGREDEKSKHHDRVTRAST